MLTIALSSNLVKPGTRRAVGRGRWPGGVRGVPGCVRGVGWSLGRVGRSVGGRLGSMAGSIGGSLGSMAGSIGGSLGSMAGSIGGSLGSMAGSIGGSLGSMAGSIGALKVLCFVVVLHNPWLRAVTLVGFPVKHVAILTVTFLSINVQRGASWAILIRRGRGVVGGSFSSMGGSIGGSLGSMAGSIGGSLGSMAGCVGGSLGSMAGSIGGSLGSMAGSRGTLKVPCLVAVLHNPWLRAVTLVGFPVKHVAILTVTFLSISVQRGASWAILIRRGRGVVGGSFSSMGGSIGGSLGNMGGSVGGSLGSMAGSVGGSLGSMAGSVGALKVLCLVVVLHNPWLRAVTLVGFPVKHVAILTVTFLSISVQRGARWAMIIGRGRGDSN